MCDTSYLPLQKSRLAAYRDDLKAALNQATWKRSTPRYRKNYHRNLAQHIPPTRGCGFEAYHLPYPLNHPAPLPNSDQSVWDNWGKIILEYVFIKVNENRSPRSPTRVFVKTTPEVWRITELHSCKPPRHRVKLLPNYRIRHFHLHTACPSNCSTCLWWRSLCDTLLQLGYTTLGTCSTSCWESWMCSSCLFAGAAGRSLKTAWMQLQTHSLTTELEY